MVDRGRCAAERRTADIERLDSHRFSGLSTGEEEAIFSLVRRLSQVPLCGRHRSQYGFSRITVSRAAATRACPGAWSVEIGWCDCDGFSALAVDWRSNRTVSADRGKAIVVGSAEPGGGT